MGIDGYPGIVLLGFTAGTPGGWTATSPFRPTGLLGTDWGQRAVGRGSVFQFYLVCSVYTETRLGGIGVTEQADGARLAELRAWVEQVATYFTQHYGIPPIRGRVMGWLMVCEPAEQSADEIVRAIQASRASLSGALQVLAASGLVQASNRPGAGRTTYYRITDDAWAATLRRRFAGLASFLTITEQGLDLFPPKSPARGRVLAAHELFSWLQGEIEPLWERWDAEQSPATQREPHADHTPRRS